MPYVKEEKICIVFLSSAEKSLSHAKSNKTHITRDPEFLDILVSKYSQLSFNDTNIVVTPIDLDLDDLYEFVYKRVQEVIALNRASNFI